MSDSTERTFIMVQPDGVQRGLVGKIIERFEQKGFKLVAMKCGLPRTCWRNTMPNCLLVPSGFINYISSVVKTGRQMLNATNHADLLAGTIRSDFCIQVDRNIIHGSDKVESAKKEIALCFNEKELVDWKHV